MVAREPQCYLRFIQGHSKWSQLRAHFVRRFAVDVAGDRGECIIIWCYVTRIQVSVCDLGSHNLLVEPI